LGGSLGPRDAGAGSIYFHVVFENRTESPCTMSGFPGVSFLDARGMQIGVPAQRADTAFGTVTVPAGGRAYAGLQVANPGTATCPDRAVAKIRVFPPGEGDDLLIPVSDLRVCASKQSPGQVKPISDQPNG
jgi:hypothetical protein